MAAQSVFLRLFVAATELQSCVQPVPAGPPGWGQRNAAGTRLKLTFGGNAITRPPDCLIKPNKSSSQASWGWAGASSPSRSTRNDKSRNIQGFCKVLAQVMHISSFLTYQAREGKNPLVCIIRGDNNSPCRNQNTSCSSGVDARAINPAGRNHSHY